MDHKIYLISIQEYPILVRDVCLEVDECFDMFNFKEIHTL